MYTPWSLYDKTLSITISFTFVLEDKANAYILIDTPMIFTHEAIVNFQNEAGRRIEKESISFHTIENTLTDAVLALGKKTAPSLKRFNLTMLMILPFQHVDLWTCMQ